MVKIDLITGFLGSGKTTFIKKYATYLMRKGLNIGITGLSTNRSTPSSSVSGSCPIAFTYSISLSASWSPDISLFMSLIITL